MSFAALLEAARNKSPPLHPWTAPLRSMRGRKDIDGVERISTEAILEALDVPPFRRTPEAAKQLRRLMLALGWTPVRARHVTSRGRASRVRGYARMAGRYSEV